MAERIYILTGATSGLGLEVAKTLVKQSGTRIVAGARKPHEARALRAVADEGRIAILPLDLADLASVKAFCASVARVTVGQPIDGVACNAGVQLVGPLSLTEMGIESTFAANHLGHFAMVHHLLDYLSPGAAVVSTASGTHDPSDATARRFGFRGGIFPSAEAVARGELDSAASMKQHGLDRYATSKLCNILFTYEMARRMPVTRARFVAFDPGLMPGTGLARERSSIEQLGWTYVLPLMRVFSSGVSTPKRSGRALARLLAEPDTAPGTGLHFDFTLAQTPSSTDSHRLDWAQALYATSARFAGCMPLVHPTASPVTPTK